MAPFIMSTRRDELGVDPFSVVPDATATIVAAAIFLTLAWISCAMRFYTRVRLVKSFGADDSAMAITLVRRTCSIVYAAELTPARYCLVHTVEASFHFALSSIINQA